MFSRVVAGDSTAALIGWLPFFLHALIGGERGGGDAMAKCLEDDLSQAIRISLEAEERYATHNFRKLLSRKKIVIIS
jgi:hypothetical protein